MTREARSIRVMRSLSETNRNDSTLIANRLAATLSEIVDPMQRFDDYQIRLREDLCLVVQPGNVMSTVADV